MINKTTVSYLDQSTDLEAFVAYPSEEKRPLVFLCHAWKGRDDFICEKAEIIANLGYVGFAIDMYGKGVLGKSKAENATLKKPFVEDRSLMRRRLLKGYEAACAFSYVDCSRIVALGFGFGALCALEMAWSGVELNGVVSVYGHFDQISVHPIKTKILILHGYKDPVTPMSELNLFQQKLDRAKVDWQAHIYGNACHAFATPNSNESKGGYVYDSIFSKRFWKAIKSFLKGIFFI